MFELDWYVQYDGFDFSKQRTKLTILLPVVGLAVKSTTGRQCTRESIPLVRCCNVGGLKLTSTTSVNTSISVSLRVYIRKVR